jgi:hypothetical protein
VATFHEDVNEVSSIGPEYIGDSYNVIEPRGSGETGTAARLALGISGNAEHEGDKRTGRVKEETNGRPLAHLRVSRPRPPR